jgi:mono/diheme cytochrome c family protein
MSESIRSRLLFLILPLILVTGCRNNPEPQTQRIEVPSAEQFIQKGEYLVTVSSCHDCHSPKDVGPGKFDLIPDRILSGYPADRPFLNADLRILKTGWTLFTPDLTMAVGPWGASFSANLTSDQTGIGNWTEENFKRALTQGKYKGLENSRTLLPPMPWMNYANMTEEDVKAIFSYLKNTKPVNNTVPMPIPPDQLAARLKAGK